jgi:hypothetical protein
MNCQEFWESGGEDLGHLRDCPACAMAFRQDRAITVGLKSLGIESRRLEAPPAVERRLVAAFRREMGVAPAPRRGLFPLLTWGAAMAATVALALVLMHGRQPQPAQHRFSRSGLELAAADVPYTIDVTADLRDRGFIPLPNADQLDPDDEMDVVRMQMPRSTLIALGVPVADDEDAASVEADVLLGGDGVARAVRFLD